MAFGSVDALLTGVSVVPTMILLCQGTANKTRLSSVLGIMIAVSEGRNSLSKTIWIPWLIVTRSSALASSIFKIESVKTPVALMIAFAFTSWVGEDDTFVNPSFRSTPQTLLFAFISPSTLI